MVDLGEPVAKAVMVVAAVVARIQLLVLEEEMVVTVLPVAMEVKEQMAAILFYCTRISLTVIFMENPSSALVALVAPEVLLAKEDLADVRAEVASVLSKVILAHQEVLEALELPENQAR
jgi:hypothetical protein